MALKSYRWLQQQRTAILRAERAEHRIARHRHFGAAACYFSTFDPRGSLGLAPLEMAAGATQVPGPRRTSHSPRRSPSSSGVRPREMPRLCEATRRPTWRACRSSDDFLLMSPFGGRPSLGVPYTPEAIESIARFFKNGSFEQELIRSWSSPDTVVLATIERTDAEVGGLPAQDWALRVTLVYRRDGSDGVSCIAMQTRSRAASRWPKQPQSRGATSKAAVMSHSLGKGRHSGSASRRSWRHPSLWEMSAVRCARPAYACRRSTAELRIDPLAT